MRLYFIAFQFLTIIPLPFPVRCDEKSLGRSMALFPLVGLTLGGVLAGADFLLGWVFPRQLSDLLIIVLLTAVTGALHMDGLADVCDGLAARGGRERFLTVMKDPHTGAVGVVGLVLALLLKYMALLAVPVDVKREVLFLFPAVARFSQVLMAVGSQRARDNGLGALFAAGAGMPQLVIAGLLTLVAAPLLMGVKGICCLVAVLLLTWGGRTWAHRRLGGVTGDVIGCFSELSEILFLLVTVALAGKGIV